VCNARVIFLENRWLRMKHIYEIFISGIWKGCNRGQRRDTKMVLRIKAKLLAHEFVELII
jgi:hypothetical protein